MNDGAERWREVRRAWDRLHRWRQRPGGDPLEALGAIGQVRRQLDEAELDAVRSARRRGSSWAEIAIKLGVTRQSAWERWRELDEEPAGPAGARAAPEPRPRVEGSVTVPDVVGMPYDHALEMLAEHRLVGIPADPHGPSSILDQMHGAVVYQSPEAGAVAPPGAPVTLWTESDGGSGVREPRRPRPTPLAERGYGEPSEEAVG